MNYLGVDVGGSKVAARIIGDRPATAAEVSMAWPASGGPAADLAALADLVHDLVRRAGPVAGVGVAMPATVDRTGTVVSWPGRPAWVGLELAGALRSACSDAPLRWADDGDLAALAEARHAGCPDLVYLGVGTGVGGGLVVDGRLLPGPDRGSCELGHLVVDLHGVVCDCGRTGCLQSIASGAAITRAAGVLLGRPVPPAELHAGWRQRTSWAVAALERAAAALSAAVVGVSELVRPELALVGGGFAAAFDGFVELVDLQVGARRRAGHSVPPVRAAALGGLSSLAGAVELARDAAAG